MTGLNDVYRFLQSVAPSRAAAAVFALQLTVVLFMMIWERRRPAYPLDRRRTWKRDATAFLVYNIAIVPAALFIDRYVSFTPVLPPRVFAVPFALRFALFFVIGDLGFYWVHRAMHSKWLWSLHRWHHSPTYMYWLMGVRGSLLQQTLVNVPYLFAQALLAVAPWWAGLAIVFKNALQNNWMHLNVNWGYRWLEWIIVTPRYHHIHHSDNPAYYGANIAGVFPIWDRLFGTYVDPETVQGQLSFGTDEKAAPWRLAIGV